MKRKTNTKSISSSAKVVSGTKKCSACVKSVALDKATRTLGTRFVLALKKAVFYRCGVCTVLLFCRRLRKKFMDVLLSSLRYSSRQNLHAAKCEVSSFVTVFSVFRFSRSFFSMNESQAAAKGQSTKQKEQATPAVHDDDDSRQNTSPTMLAILNSALQAT